jgi:hypothetical protein
MLEVKAWTEDLGVSEQDQLAIIEAIMQRRGSDPPARLKYFTPAMQRFAAEQNRPPLLPTDGGSNAPATREDQREAARRREEERRARIYEAAARGST